MRRTLLTAAFALVSTLGAASLPASSTVVQTAQSNPQPDESSGGRDCEHRRKPPVTS